MKTGDPIPARPVRDRVCTAARNHRWLGSRPRTPLAIVRGKEIKSAGQPCCAPWAIKGSRWLAVDAYGQLAGAHILEGGEGYDVTQCYDLRLRALRGGPGAGVFVNEDSGWKPAKSLRWTPTANERLGLEKLVGAVERIAVPGDCIGKAKDVPLPLIERTLFFAHRAHFQRGPLPGEKVTLGPGGWVTPVFRWAVVGGRLLIVARLQHDGRWVLRHLAAQGGGERARIYQPLAVLDMNGDGGPEIVLHSNFGDSWGDTVLQWVSTGWEGDWREVAVGVHDGTAQLDTSAAMVATAAVR